MWKIIKKNNNLLNLEYINNTIFKIFFIKYTSLT